VSVILKLLHVVFRKGRVKYPVYVLRLSIDPFNDAFHGRKKKEARLRRYVTQYVT